ncbi:MAG: peptidase M15, partial [Parabacteroides sp.]
MKKQGLVDVMEADTTLRLHLYYATSVNFMGKSVYKGITRAWLHPKAAAMLVKASLLLHKEHPHWHLLIYDAARPMSV